MFRDPTLHPPWIAAWLVDLISSNEQRETIQGDLLEEYSEIALRSGIPSARRWYWKQSAKTVFQLGLAGFRDAPASIVAIALGGFLLQLLAFALWGRMVDALLDFTTQSVIPFYTWPEVKAHLFWLTNATFAGQIVVPLLVGCMVATAAKGKEMVCTIALASLRAIFLVAVFARLSLQGMHLPWTALASPWAQLMLILMGGVIVREIRLARSKTALKPPPLSSNL